MTWDKLQGLSKHLHNKIVTSVVYATHFGIEKLLTLLSSTFRPYGSLPSWKRDFLNLSTRRRLMLWCEVGGSCKLMISRKC